MPTRLTPLEVSMLALDTAHTPTQLGTVDIFEAGPDGFDYERLIALIRDRIRYVPRYRQRIMTVPARLAGPVWTDDEDFDLTFHVRRSALPRPGTRAQLWEFVGRVMARRLDRSRPLWEMYLIEGLEDDRFALLTKSHQALVDGIDTVEIGQVLLDETADSPAIDSTEWHPTPEPSAIELVAGAVRDGVADPSRAVVNAQQTVTGALGVAVAVGEMVGGLGSALGELAQTALLRGRAPGDGPLTGVVSEQRRFATVSADLADFRQLRAEHDHTINDVVLAMITGGLRSWLLTRGEAVTSTRRLTALVPMSVTESDDAPTSLGSQVAPYLMSLPIGEPNALMRLHQVAYGTQAHKDTGRAIGARTISDIAGFAPTTLHALGIRVSGENVRKQYDLVITNAPGPQMSLFAVGSPMIASYPVIPLEPGRLLAIGVTSYNGQVFLGLTADRDELADLDVLAQCMRDALEELLEATATASTVRQPTRKPSAEAREAAAKKIAAKAEARAMAQRNAARRAAEKRAAVKQALRAQPTTTRVASTPAAAEDERPRKEPAKKAAAKKAATKKAPAKKAPAKKAPAKKATAKKATAKQTSSRVRKPPGRPS